ncbi:hypothetical protein KP78_25530 [Jeotgalibacillus soli]|uniref:Uncharacterized protein n=1 Tax=Jeotgalibacillus soli TaxID=889306 RepID=A0A0C2RTG4_9BACL|nr:hypothetical protein KP78_25530 [Jeotgalibacillus soli]
MKDPNIIFNKFYPLITEIFGNQFTADDLAKGIDVREVMPIVSKAIDHVIENMKLSNQKAGIQREKVVVPFDFKSSGKRIKRN